MAYTTSGAEMRDCVEKVEHAFITAPTFTNGKGRSLRDRASLVEAIVMGTYDYTKDLPRDLQHKVPAFPHLLRVYRQQAAAAMRADIKISVEPRGAGSRAEHYADELEIAEAHWWQELDPYGYIVDNMRKACVSEFFWAGMIEAKEYIAPEKRKGESAADFRKRARNFREGHFGYQILRKPMSGVSFLEGYDRQPNVGISRYRLPVVDLMEKFGKDYKVSRDNPEHMDRVFEEHFGWLQASQPQGDRRYGTSDYWDQEIEIVAIDDGKKICFCCDLGEGKNSRGAAGRYRGIGDVDYPNTFGMCSMVLVRGVYNDGWPVAYRSEPILMATVNIQHEQAQQRSVLASRLASPLRQAQVLPPEVAVEVARGSNIPPQFLNPQFSDATGRPQLAATLGEIATLSQTIDPVFDKYFGLLQMDMGVAAPRGLISDPEARSNAARTPSSTFLVDIDEHDRLLSEAQGSVCAAIDRFIEMIENDQRQGLNGHRQKGDKRNENLDWDRAFTTSGHEPVFGKQVERGQQIRVTPQMLDADNYRTITPVDNRENVKAAKRAEVMERLQAPGGPYITHRDAVQGMGNENPTRFDEEMNADKLYQFDFDRIVVQGRSVFAGFSQKLFGLSPERMIAAALNTGMPPEGAQGSQPRPPSTNNYQLQSPQTEGAATTMAETMTST